MRRTRECTSAHEPTNNVTILVVEDEVLVRLMLADELREQGFQVYEAVDAKQAVSILKTMPVDAVVTDLHMRTFREGISFSLA